MADNILKSYLVSLGFNVNDTEYAKMSDALNRSSQQVTNYTTGMTKSFLRASTEIVGSLASVTAATVGLIDKVSQADLKYQEFALQMHMSLPAAKEMKIVLDAMGESMTNVAWIPELRQRYFALQAQARQLEMGQGAEGTFRQMRDLRFEVTRLKLESTYMMQYIAVDVWNKLASVFGNTKMTFKEFNDYITTHMPQIASMIGDKLVWVVKQFTFLYDFIRDKAIPEIKSFWEELKKVIPNIDQLKEALVALGLVFIGLTSASGPIMLFRVGIAAVIELAKDFNDYISGKTSNATLAPMWKELKEALPTIKKDFEEAKVAAKEWGIVLADIIPTISSIVDHLTGTKDSLSKAIQDTIQQTIKRSEALAYVFQAMELAGQGKYGQAWSRLKLANATFGEEALNPTEQLSKDIFEATGGTKTPNTSALSGAGGETIAGVKQNESVPGLGAFAENLANKGERSGGDYSSPAHMDAGKWNLGGKYQILAENWGQWASEAGLGSDADYKVPANQEAVAQFQLAKAYQQYGSWGAVAAWWNGGPDAAESYLKRGTYKGENGYVGRVLGNANNVSSTLAAGAQNFASMTGSTGNTAPTATNNGYSLQTNIGGLNINITQPGASGEEISMHVLNVLQTTLQRQNARLLNDWQGVHS